MSLKDLEKKLSEYEKQLKNNQFVQGPNPSYEDSELFETLIKNNYKPSQEKFPSVWAWYSLMILFEDEVIKEWKLKSNQENKKGKSKHKQVVEEPEEPEKFPYKEEYKKIINDQKLKHSNEKSVVFLEINPENTEINLDNLAKKVVKDIKREDIKWFEKYEIKEFAFEVKKLIMGMVVGLNGSVQDVMDQLETWEEEIQSVEFASFNQL